jgi:hypothetical protein
MELVVMTGVKKIGSRAVLELDGQLVVIPLGVIWDVCYDGESDETIHT